MAIGRMTIIVNCSHLIEKRLRKSRFFRFSPEKLLVIARFYCIDIFLKGGGGFSHFSVGSSTTENS